MLINFMNEFLVDTDFKQISPKIFKILNDFTIDVNFLENQTEFL